MESLLNRYRSLTVLLAVLLAQLVLVAYQVRTGGDVRLLRVWAVSLTAPPGKAIEAARSAVAAWWSEYLWLVHARRENRQLREEVNRLKLENRFLRSELGAAERAQALAQFRARTPSQTIAVRVVAAASGLNARVVFVDRGAEAGVRAGMAVINPAGLAGRVTAVYPSVSQVMLVTAEGFSAGVICGRSRVQGILRGLGRPECAVTHVHSDEDVKPGDWFYTSGEDRIFPRGLPAGEVKSVGGSGVFKEILLKPAAPAGGLEELLIVTAPIHQALPDEQPVAGSAPLLPAPRPPGTSEATAQREPATALQTDADRLLERYRREAAPRGAVQTEGGSATQQQAAPAPPAANANPVRP
jgi:rod shape-determining protein MreC